MKTSHQRFWHFSIGLILALVLIVACSGSAGPAGPAGPAGQLAQRDPKALPVLLDQQGKLRLQYRRLLTLLLSVGR